MKVFDWYHLVTMCFNWKVLLGFKKMFHGQMFIYHYDIPLNMHIMKLVF